MILFWNVPLCALYTVGVSRALARVGFANFFWDFRENWGLKILFQNVREWLVGAGSEKFFGSVLVGAWKRSDVLLLLATENRLSQSVFGCILKGRFLAVEKIILLKKTRSSFLAAEYRSRQSFFL